MALNKQVHIYSLDTSAFYNKNELMIHKYLNRLYFLRNKAIKIRKKRKHKDNKKLINQLNNFITRYNRKIKEGKEKLYKEFGENKDIRHLNEEYINKYNIISVFESSLTRIFNISANTISEDIMIVQTYFFDVIEDTILNGFMYKNEKYICFTASAGQIRTKKTVFIKESVLTKHYNSLTCGLNLDIINSHGGVNVNKYLAYLALCNSATDLWEDFDIRKSIVVEDMETLVNGLVDFINDKTYEITKQYMDIPINHTDGCGMILKSKKSKMARLPWIKGLLVPHPYDKFIREKSKETGVYCGIIKDIYGKEHDILKEGIEVIFTKSQFKMWKYYDSWEQYQENFIKYHCQAGKCNEEEDIFSDAKINYQMLQTLTDMSDIELKTISKKTKDNIYKIGRDRRTMLKVFGVSKSNRNKTNLQNALTIYPELLGDVYTKEILKQIKKSLVKDARAGKLSIKGKYTFICPDLYAFCEFLFLGDKNPKGLLENKQVYCKLYNDSPELDCLRSPHLFREHSVKNNIIDTEKSRWFVTDGLYTSCHDLISKTLQFDVDGDKSLVCADKTIIDVAKRNMKDIVPLYYNMKKAPAEIINSNSIYNGLKTAYTGGNIGMYSNNITKIWNSDDINLNVIKLLCMENNFTIDHAKTLYKPERPPEIGKVITKYIMSKTPHFFIYAKDKTKDKVASINNSVVNRLEKIIPNPRIDFNAANLGKFNYKMLMNNKDVELDNEIIKKYKELDLKNHFVINKETDDNSSNVTYLYENIHDKLLEINSDVYYVTDVLIKYLYDIKKSRFKETLWLSFGDIIVENLKNNIKQELDNGYIQCEMCGKRVEETINNKKYCRECQKELQKQWQRESMRKLREQRKLCEVANEVCNPHTI